MTDQFILAHPVFGYNEDLVLNAITQNYF
jgi:hypothetical protein